MGAPRSRWVGLLLAGGAGIALGAPWYLLNLAETGELDGGLSADADQRQPLALLEVATTFRRHLYSLLDFSGTRALDLTALYGIAAVVVLAIGLAVAVRGRRREGIALAIGVALVVLLPRVLLTAADAGMHAWVKGWVVLGRRDIADADDSWQPQSGSDAGLSWYGPLGAILVGAALVLAVLALRRRRSGWTPVVLAGAPLLLIIVLALTVSWDPWRGRLIAFSILLAAATWGARPRAPLARVGCDRARVRDAPALAARHVRTTRRAAAWLDGIGRSPPSVWTAVAARVAAVGLGRRCRAGEVLAGVPDGCNRCDRAAPRRPPLPLARSHGEAEERARPVDGGRVPGDATVLVVAPGTHRRALRPLGASCPGGRAGSSNDASPPPDRASLSPEAPRDRTVGRLAAVVGWSDRPIEGIRSATDPSRSGRQPPIGSPPMTPQPRSPS